LCAEGTRQSIERCVKHQMASFGATRLALRRMLNVAVRKKLLALNPCSGVEFPVAVKGLFRPHYVSWSELQAHLAECAECRSVLSDAGEIYSHWLPERPEFEISRDPKSDGAPRSKIFLRASHAGAKLSNAAQAKSGNDNVFCF
jgi:hypothetical protein